MKLVVCTKFQVNRMSCVESRRGDPIDPPPLKASCNYFFLYAFRVNRAGEFQNLDLIIFTPMGDFLQMPSENY